MACYTTDISVFNELYLTIFPTGLKDTPNELSVRIFLIMVWFMSLVVDTVYQGHITAFIAMPR